MIKTKIYINTMEIGMYMYSPLIKSSDILVVIFWDWSWDLLPLALTLILPFLVCGVGLWSFWSGPA